MGLLSMLGLSASREKVNALVERGAVIVDVRTPGEYASGHIRGSQNIPLDELQHRIDEIVNMEKPVITCCASGMRSGSAAAMLKNAGVESVNGGGWQALNGNLG